MENKVNNFPFPQHRENYASLNRLRAFAALGIVLMHVQANMAIKPSVNYLTSNIIGNMACLTLLFMMVSAFSMCCGYYDRVRIGAITPQAFYSKRYHRAWPFFAIMVTLSFLMDPSWNTFCQTFADLTLCFNLLPNPHIEIIGVGWFLGLVFTFYMLFPFFTFLLSSKKKSWMVLALSLMFCYIEATYFCRENFVVRPITYLNIVYCAPFFIVGGMAYLYRKEIKTWHKAIKYLILICCVLFIIVTSMLHMKLFIFPILTMYLGFLIYAISSNGIILNNKITKYLSGISMEIYLCHMMFFRVASMLHLENYIHQCDVLFVVTFLVTLMGAVCFSHVTKYWVIPKIEDYLTKIVRKTTNNE